MFHLSNDEWRRAFSTWLRTGRLPPVWETIGAERKFNPWHDPDDGRFTFAGRGVHYGGPSGGNNGARRAPRPKTDRRLRSGDDFTGGSFGGAGAEGSYGPPDPTRQLPKPSTAERGATRVPVPGRTTQPSGSTKPTEQFRTVVGNGYTYQIDIRGRTRRVSGALTVSDAPRRSRTTQVRAGGVDRRTSDDGGHYIAARFNGPTEAFNHFAQDANFNRGSYRLLEDQWARAKHAGKGVWVTIVPYFNGRSSRPRDIDVWFTIDGRLESQKFPNERSEKRRGK